MFYIINTISLSDYVNNDISDLKLHKTFSHMFNHICIVTLSTIIRKRASVWSKQIEISLDFEKDFFKSVVVNELKFFEPSHNLIKFIVLHEIKVHINLYSQVLKFPTCFHQTS